MTETTKQYISKAIPQSEPPLLELDLIPDSSRFSIWRELAVRIIDLSAHVEQLDAARIEIVNDTPEWFVNDKPVDGDSIARLVVTSTEFWFRSNFHGVDVCTSPELICELVGYYNLPARDKVKMRGGLQLLTTEQLNTLRSIKIEPMVYIKGGETKAGPSNNPEHYNVYVRYSNGDDNEKCLACFKDLYMATRYIYFVAENYGHDNFELTECEDVIPF